MPSRRETLRGVARTGVGAGLGVAALTGLAGCAGIGPSPEFARAALVRLQAVRLDRRTGESTVTPLRAVYRPASDRVEVRYDPTLFGPAHVDDETGDLRVPDETHRRLRERFDTVRYRLRACAEGFSEGDGRACLEGGTDREGFNRVSFTTEATMVYRESELHVLRTTPADRSVATVEVREESVG